METIFKKGKVRESFEPLKVSDVIEVLNHIHCVDYILDHVMEPLTQKFIRKLHHLLMTGTVDEYRELGLSLNEIGNILDAPDYDRNRVLEHQIKLMQERVEKTTKPNQFCKRNVNVRSEVYGF